MRITRIKKGKKKKDAQRLLNQSLSMYILGSNAYHGDASAAIIENGKLIAAVEEERFNRFKHCAGFPSESIRYCLEAASIVIEDVAHVGISRDPSAHLHKKVLFAATRAAKQVRRGRRGDDHPGKRESVHGIYPLEVVT